MQIECQRLSSPETVVGDVTSTLYWKIGLRFLYKIIVLWNLQYCELLLLDTYYHEVVPTYIEIEGVFTQLYDIEFTQERQWFYCDKSNCPLQDSLSSSSLWPFKGTRDYLGHIAVTDAFFRRREHR